MPSTGNLLSERFNGGADGVAITTGNSSISAVNAGTPTFETTDKTPIEGSAQAKFDMTVAQSVRWDFVNSGSTPLYVTCYHYASATPSVATSHVLMNMNTTTTVRAQIRYLSTGAYRLINQTATTVASTTGTYSGQDVRYRWKLDWGAGTQSLDIFIGSNLHGTTPDETISGTLTNATRDRLVLGSLGSVSATAGYHLIDVLDASDTAFTDPVPQARTGTASLSLSATGAGKGVAAGTASLSLSATGAATGSSSAAGTASLSLSASGTARATAAGAASLTLSATAATTSSATGTASLALTGIAATSSADTGTGTITLSGSGTVSAVAAGTATLSLGATGSTKAPAAGTAALSLSATGVASGGGQATGTASLVLTATGGVKATAAGTGSITITATGAARGNAAGTGSLQLVGAGTLAAMAAGQATLALAATGTAAAGGGPVRDITATATLIRLWHAQLTRDWSDATLIRDWHAGPLTREWGPAGLEREWSARL